MSCTSSIASCPLLNSAKYVDRRGGTRGLQGYVAYLGWPKAPSYMSPNAGGGGGVAGPQLMSTAVHRSPKNLRRSNFIFSLWVEPLTPVSTDGRGVRTQRRQQLKFWPLSFLFSVYNCLSVAPPPLLYWWESCAAHLWPLVPAVESLEYVNEVLVVGSSCCGFMAEAEG